MKNFNFALLGMVAAFCLLCSCSYGEKESTEQTKIEKEEKHDEEAEEDLPGEEEEENPGVPMSPSLPEDDEEEQYEEEKTSPSSTVEKEPVPEKKPEVEIDPNISEDDSSILKLLINELRTEYTNSKAEYIEFKITSSGNLGGVRVFIASNYKNPLVFEFAPVEVKAGEYIVLHLRTLNEASSVNEYGGDLTESGGADSCAHARDFWIPGNEELLRKTDIVYVMDQDERIMDAVLFSDKSESEWPKLSKQDCFPAAAEFLFSQDAWKTADGSLPNPLNIVNSARSSSTQTICRDEKVKDSDTAADWYIAAKSCLTPGLKNNPKRL